MQLNYRHKSVSPCRGSLLSRGRKMTKRLHDARGTYTQCFGRKAEKWWLRSRSSEDVSCRRELSKRLKNLLGTHLAMPRHLAKAAHKRLREEVLEENQLELEKDTPNCPFIQHSPSSYPWCLFSSVSIPPTSRLWRFPWCLHVTNILRLLATHSQGANPPNTGLPLFVMD